MPEYSLTRSREFAANHPDFNESLHRAHREGHTLADAAVEHLKKRDRLDVSYWLSLPENRAARDKVHNLTESTKEQIAELDCIAEKLDKQGYGVGYAPKLREEDRYLEQRRQDLKAGKRRR